MPKTMPGVVGMALTIASVVIATAASTVAVPVVPRVPLCVGVPGGVAGDVAVVNVTNPGAVGVGYGALRSSDARSVPLRDVGDQFSSVNFAPGAPNPNLAFVEIGSDGRVCYDSDGAAANVILDLAATIPASGVDGSEPRRLIDTRTNGGPGARIESVWFAQTHVQQVSNQNFRLVGNRQTLLKVDVVAAAAGTASPTVTATIRNGTNSTRLTLSGPAMLPQELSSAPGVVEHARSNSFTATIPAGWVNPGLVVDVNVGDVSRREAPLVGAPSVLPMTMFDLHFFEQTTGDYTDGWEDELEAKLPVSSLEVTRVPDIVLDEIVIPHRAGLPAVLVESQDDYLQQTGSNFDGEQAAASQLIGALRRASGTRVTGLSVYYGNIYGVNAGGQAGGFGGVGNGRSLGILHHELGHAFGLPHWGNSAAYPYRGDMHGIAAPSSEVHVGPTWAYDLPSGTFIPPTVQANNVSGAPVGTYKKDPMQGGGQGDQEPGFLLRHFSDYSVAQMQRTIESSLDTYNPQTGTFQTWGDGEYVDWGPGNGLVHPVDVDIDVVAIIAATSMADQSINHIYEPFEYRGSRVRSLDPSVAADRAAASGFCPSGGCDYSLRITQGGVTSTYMLAASGSDISDPMESASLATSAINVAASDGVVTSVELLHTPDADTAGLPANPTSLDVWNG